MLARRDYSHAELAQRLRQRGHDGPAITAALAECQLQGWQDDLRFASHFIASRYRNGYGPLRISAELRQRGLNEASIHALLTADDYDWQQALQDFFVRRCKAPAADRPGRYRQARLLQLRGFDAEAIRRLLAL